MYRQVPDRCCQTRLVHWCHGAVGLLPLLLEVEGLCTGAEEAKVHAAAERAAQVIWERGLLLKVAPQDPCHISLPLKTSPCEPHTWEGRAAPHVRL